MMKNALTILLALTLTLVGVLGCKEPQEIVHPEVKTSKLLPEPKGFSFDKAYPARSEPTAGFYDYAYSASKVMTHKEAMSQIKGEMKASGWSYVSHDQSDWLEKQIWISNWRRKSSTGEWDTIRVTYKLEFDGKNVEEAKSTIIYQMGSGN